MCPDSRSPPAAVAAAVHVQSSPGAVGAPPVGQRRAPPGGRRENYLIGGLSLGEYTSVPPCEQLTGVVLCCVVGNRKHYNSTKYRSQVEVCP